MATEAFTTEDVILMDGTEFELRPLSIYNMRKFMKIWSECVIKVQTRYKEAAEDDNAVLAAVQQETQEWQYDAWIPMCALCFESLQGERTDKAFKEYLEKTLDEATIYRALDVCGNLKLGEQAPNPQTAETLTEE